MTQRREEIRDNLVVVRERISAACTHAGRSPDEVTIVVVTKFFPASDVRLLAELGVREVGENRHQEAETKAAECADLGLVWHFIGNLQSNKAAAVATYADVVESVDRTKLVGPLNRGADQRGRDLDCLLQVNLDEASQTGRSGIRADRVTELAERVLQAGALRLRGVMGVAPLGKPPAPAFARLAEVAAHVRRTAPHATWVSGGMSADLEEAVKHGATHVRIGSAVLGPRPSIK